MHPTLSGCYYLHILYMLSPRLPRPIGIIICGSAEIILIVLEALAWGGEVIKSLTRAQREVGDLRQSFDDTADHFTKLETRLAEGLRLEAEKKALATEKEALEAEKAALRAELDETKAHAEEEAGRLRSEAVNAWALGNEGFLKSSEFGILCAKKALGYFKVGFAGCVAQFRANGYSEEEHPNPLLDVKKALMEMSDEEEEEADEEEEEEDNAAATPPSSPQP
ncbi:hypothetical protein F511_06180 [Dorcoceras hygrometricum]|uniref:Uncharacterized protein n=1 Tax=Dorcoceras hygrometricum TaxID=472368 RepID=A0A2Z7CJ04_9LAMI|nr:hypothetical protein F511_06180 [Dorcoceras hygrometricum]